MTDRHRPYDDAFADAVDSELGIALENANRRGIPFDISTAAKLLWWARPFFEADFAFVADRTAVLLRLDFLTCLSRGDVAAAHRVFWDMRRMARKHGVDLPEPREWPMPRLLVN